MNQTFANHKVYDWEGSYAYSSIVEGSHTYNKALIKHWKKICSVFGGHLKSINFPPRKWEGYYAYSSIVGGFLHPYVGTISLPFLHFVSYIGLIHDKFYLMLYDR